MNVAIAFLFCNVFRFCLLCFIVICASVIFWIFLICNLFFVSVFFFFFFKQKTAYEMRISDWSSDVCSSDLEAPSAIPLVLQSVCCQCGEAHQDGGGKYLWLSMVHPAKWRLQARQVPNGVYRLRAFQPQDLSAPGWRPDVPVACSIDPQRSRANRRRQAASFCPPARHTGQARLCPHQRLAGERARRPPGPAPTKPLRQSRAALLHPSLRSAAHDPAAGSFRPMFRPRSGLSLHPSMSGPWLAVRRALLPRPLSFQCPIGRTSAQPLRGAVWECRGVTHCFA